jgi:hypothetical protein
MRTQNATAKATGTEVTDNNIPGYYFKHIHSAVVSAPTNNLTEIRFDAFGIRFIDNLDNRNRRSTYRHLHKRGRSGMFPTDRNQGPSGTKRESYQSERAGVLRPAPSALRSCDRNGATFQSLALREGRFRITSYAVNRSGFEHH